MARSAAAVRSMVASSARLANSGFGIWSAGVASGVAGKVTGSLVARVMTEELLEAWVNR